MELPGSLKRTQVVVDGNGDGVYFVLSGSEKVGTELAVALECIVSTS